MTALEAVFVVLAGVFAGGINAVVGSGTLVTFPVLLAVGYPPVVANVSNSIGLVPGSVSGAIGYRRELTGQRARLLRLGGASLLGGALGAALLLVLPPRAFEAIVPALIVLALVLVVLQPWLARKLAAMQEGRGGLAGRAAAGRRFDRRRPARRAGRPPATDDLAARGDRGGGNRGHRPVGAALNLASLRA